MPRTVETNCSPGPFIHSSHVSNVDNMRFMLKHEFERQPRYVAAGALRRPPTRRPEGRAALRFGCGSPRQRGVRMPIVRSPNLRTTTPGARITRGLALGLQNSTISRLPQRVVNRDRTDYENDTQPMVPSECIQVSRDRLQSYVAASLRKTANIPIHRHTQDPRSYEAA